MKRLSPRETPTDSTPLAARRRSGVAALAVALVWLMLAAGLSGCFGNSAPERTYFAILYPIGNQSARYVSPRYPKMLRVQRFDSAIAYDRQEIVYRSNPHQFKYYWYKLWSARPPKMLRELVATHMRHTNVFGEVSLNISERLPDYELRAEVLAIEELNTSDTEWHAHLAMRFELIRYEDGFQIWQHTFDERKLVHNHKPVYVIKSMSEILEEQMENVITGVDEAVARDTGITPPEPMLQTGGPSATPKGGTQKTPETAPEETPLEPKATPKATLKERP